ncbi:MAG: toprim domain-containing protein [Candidatus Micrarchaeota archaeon]|nr:toprim domain-containing protein [Candidatus Micrarchaeota archaeon]MCX8154267.1 toprim domain-containing protein [Candidatus Micrarchaeota archaeon]
MGKTYMDNLKYLIRVIVEVKGKVGKEDIIGAVFGQTEGLLGRDMDLRALQDSGKIGRLEPEGELSYSQNTKSTTAILRLPSSLEIEKTVMIGAALETIDKVGPYPAVFQVDKILDMRTEKRAKIRNRAKELLQKFLDEEEIDPKEIENELKRFFSDKNIIQLVSNNDKIVAHREYDMFDEIIFVEGRADVENLISYGIKNVVSVGGVSESIPSKIKEIAEKRSVILFLDGDSGAKRVARNLIEAGVKIDYVARAPDGKEVEELTKKEIYSALKRKRQIDPESKNLAEELERIINTLSKENQEEDEEQQRDSSDTQTPPKDSNTKTQDDTPNHLEYLKQIIGKKQVLMLFNDRTTRVVEALNLIPELKDNIQNLMAIYIDGIMIPDKALQMIASSESVKYLGYTNPNAKYSLQTKLQNFGKKNIKVVSLDD